MTGEELQHIRRRLGAEACAFGRAIGLKGKEASITSALRRLEAKSAIPDRFALTAGIYDQFPGAWTWVVTDLLPRLGAQSNRKQAYSSLDIDPFV